MRFLPAALVAVSLWPAPAWSQQPQADVQIVAQAYDRCMATYAVRLTKTASSDEDIYLQAAEGCLGLGDRLKSAISAQLPAPQAAEILAAMEAQAKPSFINMLAQIRSDRARRTGN
jgi:hypothetical protein